jgi:hypothetical protein
MTKKEVRKAAKQSILDGKTKQETFETLKETSKLPTEDLAKIVQSIPSLQARQKYKMPNMILIGLLTLTVLFKMMAGIPIIIENGIKWFPVLFILPIINILLLIGAATYTQNSHKWVAVFTILGLLRSLSDILGQPFEPLIIIDLTIAAGLIGLGFYLNSKLCPDYLTVHNSTYPKVAVQWLNQALLMNISILKVFVSPSGLCFYQSFCLVDSESLRNRHLLVAANRLFCLSSFYLTSNIGVVCISL